MKSILKKTAAYLLSFAMLITLIPFTFLSVSAELLGAGTETDPITIATLADLEAFRDSVNGGETYEGKFVKLTTDIDLSEKYGADINGQEVNWTAIGDENSNKPFNGSFDGDHHKIIGLYINRGGDNPALFGCIGNNGTVKNLTVSGEVTQSSMSGIVAATNNGIIKNVSAAGSVSGNQHVGGICGMNYGTIENCSNAAAVNTDVENAGGICSYNSGSVKNCYNTGSVTGKKNVGGICGYNSYSSRGTTILNCYNAAPVTASDESAGGICGLNSGSVDNCYNVGPVTATNNYAGGISGSTDSGLSNCYNYANVISNGRKAAVCAFVSGRTTPSNNYYNGDAFDGAAYLDEVGDVIQSGKLSEADFADKTKFDGFDFENTWVMNEKAARPMLKNLEEPSGSEYNPLKIESLADLEEFADSVNRGTTYEGKFLKLAADINLSEKYGANNQWTPIGTKENPFSGSFNGNGHTVSGLYINDVSKTYQGLFGFVSGGKVEMLAVTDAQVVANKYFAGIAAYMTNGTIENCCYSGKLGANDGVIGYYGAIAGEIENESTLKNCYAYAEIPDYSPSDSWAGGVIAGTAYCSQVISCYFNSTGNENRTAVGRSPQSTVDSYTGGKTAAELADRNTYNGWDFENIWTMHPILGLPTFSGGGFSGDGTENNPYIISTLGDLEILASAVNGGNNFEKTYFALGSDIDMSGKYNAEKGKSWTPIGSSDCKFSGVFDGRNHKITGLYIKDRTDNHTGLFGYISYNNFWQEGETYRASIKNLTVSGSITGNDKYTGGLVGIVDSGATVENCGAEVDITSGSSVYIVGGLVGNCYGTIKNSFASGNISAKGTVGGLLGSNSYGTIQNCYSLGSVTGEENVGGFIGYNEGGTVVNSYSLANITGGKPLFGNGYGTVKNCYYTGNTADTFSESVSKTKARFESGEVACLLSQGCTVHDDYSGDTTYDGTVWKQTIGKDKFPNFAGLAVSATTGCVTYNNNGDTSEKEHNIDQDGTCADCGMYGGATLVDGVYQINNEKDFIWFAALVNSGETEANAILNNSISFNADAIAADGTLDISDKDSLENFTPIGNADKPYNGTFDGNGKTVSGIFIGNTELSYAGIFGVTGESAVIKNLNVTSTYVEAKKYVGILAGQNNGTIKLCKVYGDVTGIYSNYDGGTIGGICGENRGTIAGEDKYNLTEFSGNVTVRNGGGNVGGIVGGNMGTIRYASNSGKIGVDEKRQNVGGIAGANGSFSGGKAAIIENCTNIGSVSGELSVGGICGVNYKDAKVKGCTNGTENFTDEKGTIDAPNFAGGIVGENFGDVWQCVNNLSAKINVNLTDDGNVAGGIVGENYGSIGDCINRTVNVFGSTVGGIGGRNNVYDAYKGTMQNCLNMVSGSVLGTCAEGADAPVNCCYYSYDGSEKFDYGEAATDDDVRNGCLTYRLQNGREEQIWGQKINEDTMPVLTSDNGKHVFKAKFTAADGTIIEQYYSYYDYIELPNGVLWLTKDGQIVLGGRQIESDIEAWESLYGVRGYGSNLTVHAPKGTCTLIVAGYTDDGALIGITTVSLTFEESGQQDVVAPVSGDVVKAMLVNSLTEMQPLSQFSLIP